MGGTLLRHRAVCAATARHLYGDRITCSCDSVVQVVVSLR